MFCSKCGSRMEDNAQFCPSCGAQNPAAGGSVNPAGNYAGEPSPTSPAENYAGGNFSGGNFTSRVNELGINPMLFYANLALIILGGIFAASKIFKVSVFGFSESATMFEDADGLKVLCVILYLVSVCLIVQPLITGGELTPGRFLMAKIVIIISLICFIMVYADSSSNIKSDNVSWTGAKLGLTGAGLFYLITNIGALVLTFINSKELKKRW